MGRHDGIHLFTVGQRQGLGLSLGRRAYVAAIEAPERRVVLTTNKGDLLASEVTVTDVRWHRPPPSRCQVQVRYRHQATEAAIELHDDEAVVKLFEPVTAVTPGQAAVFYDGEEVLGSGWILY